MMEVRPRTTLILLLTLLGGIAPGNAAADEWPNWRGPRHDGTLDASGPPIDWPAQGPRLVWQASVGKGFSSLALSAGRLFTMGNEDDADQVVALDAQSGRKLWTHRYACPLTPLSYEGGPSATPAVDQQRVYTLSKHGHLFCLAAESGAVIWSKSIPTAQRKEGDYGVDWGFAGSPLVFGQRLVLCTGWAGVALDKADGKVLWDNGPGRPGYASPVPFTHQGRACLALFAARGIVAVEVETGKVLWTIPWRTTWDQNAPDVLISDGRMLVTTGHSVGCALFDIQGEAPRELWRNKNLRSELASPVLWKGAVYGFDNARLACLDWQTGASRWSVSGFGRGTLIVAGGRLLVVGERGKVAMAEASPDGFKQLGEYALPGEARYWTAPIYAAGRLVVRNAQGQVFCLDLQATKP